jgi:hypothetical protein
MRSITGSWIAGVCLLAGCLPGVGEESSGVGGQPLTCAESTVDVGCRCSIGPVVNAEVLEQCGPSGVDAPDGTNVACCEDRLIVNGEDEGVYLCACTAILCAASEDGCRCDSDANSVLGDDESLVDDCSAFVDANDGARCCTNGDWCSCGVQDSCPGSMDEVAFCEPDSLCVEEIGRRPVAACR